EAITTCDHFESPRQCRGVHLQTVAGMPILSNRQPIPQTYPDHRIIRAAVEASFNQATKFSMAYSSACIVTLREALLSKLSRARGSDLSRGGATDHSHGRNGVLPKSILVSPEVEHVGAGFEPAVKHKQKIRFGG